MTTLIIALIIAPVIEELFFQGVLHQTLLDQKVPTVHAIIITSVLFGLSHLINTSPVHSLGTALVGLVYSYVYQQCLVYPLNIRIVVCASIHSVFNLLWIVISNTDRTNIIELIA
jgi:membrane protease YdiL (CAAX protease family)